MLNTHTRKPYPTCTAKHRQMLSRCILCGSMTELLYWMSMNIGIFRTALHNHSIPTTHTHVQRRLSNRSRIHSTYVKMVNKWRTHGHAPIHMHPSSHTHPHCQPSLAISCQRQASFSFFQLFSVSAHEHTHTHSLTRPTLTATLHATLCAAYISQRTINKRREEKKTGFTSEREMTSVEVETSWCNVVRALHLIFTFRCWKSITQSDQRELHKQ